MPEISVIVPAHNAAATIAATIDALNAQAFGGDYEVIVVDDGSRDETGALARERGARVARHERAQGPAVARNTGRAAAGAPVLAFTDADCEPAPNWLAAGWRAIADADLVQGAVSPAPGAEVGPFDRTLWIAQDSPRLYESANIFVRAELFDRIGGFRPFVRTPQDAPGTPGLRPASGTEHFGEDIVFGWTARAIGARVRFCTEAHVWHAVFPRGPRGFIAERWRLRYMPAAVREVPAMREAFLFGVFLSRRTALFDAALAAALAAVAMRRAWPLAGTLPYLGLLRRAPPWRRSAWRENLARASADALTFVALARGSVAARTVLL